MAALIRLSTLKTPTADAAASNPIAHCWRIRGELPPKVYLAITLLSFGLLLLIWWGAAHLQLVDPVFLPGPAQVAQRLGDWFREGGLLDDIGISVYRVGMGFALSLLMAVPLGLYIGAYRPVQAFFEPIMEFSRYLPAVAFVPLVLLWVGIGEASKVTIIWIGTFFQMVLMIADNVRQVPLAQIEAAQTLGADQGEVLNRVVLKSALPAIVDTLRITLGWAWTYLVVAELVAANSGLGYAILRAQRFLQTDKIFVGILLIGALGLLMDQAFRLLHRRAFPWLH